MQSAKNADFKLNSQKIGTFCLFLSKNRSFFDLISVFRSP